MMKLSFKKNKGFTIIETMITIGVFLIVLTIGMNSLLNASAVHQKSQDQRSVMDSLTFIMEDMSRNIRTGYNYRCVASNVAITPAEASGAPKSCVKGATLIFENGAGDISVFTDQWIYKVESPDGTENFNIYKSTDGASSFTQLNPSEIVFDKVTGFTVTGAEPPSAGDTGQPLVTINLEGKMTTKGVVTPFSIQTTVSQRVVDQ